MSPSQLDSVYTALAEAINQAGADKAPLFLATLALGLAAKHDDAEMVLAEIAQALALSRV